MTDPLSEADLFVRLGKLGIETVTHRHAAVFTVDEAKATYGQIPGGHCKNLFLKDKKGVLWLVVTPYDAVLDMNALGRRIGSARLSFGKPELMMEVLGVAPGSVTPFALANDVDLHVRVILEAKMMASALLNFHPLINTKTTSITPADLLKFIRAGGHQPEILDL